MSVLQIFSFHQIKAGMKRLIMLGALKEKETAKLTPVTKKVKNENKGKS